MTLKFFRFVRGPSRVPLQSRWEAAVLDLAVSLPRSYFVGLPWSSFARRPISISPSSLWTCSIDSSDRCRRASHAGQPQGREGNLSRALFAWWFAWKAVSGDQQLAHPLASPKFQTTGTSVPHRASCKPGRSRVAGCRYSTRVPSAQSVRTRGS